MVPRGDAELVVVAIATEPLCVKCLVKKTGVATLRVERALATIRRILTVRRRSICHACLDGGTVFRLV
jgi:hypothetical protein